MPRRHRSAAQKTVRPVTLGCLILTLLPAVSRAEYAPMKGIQFHRVGGDHRPWRDLPKFSDVGVSLMRTDAFWSSMQGLDHIPPLPPDTSRFNGSVNTVLESGGQVVAILDYATPWAVPDYPGERDCLGALVHNARPPAADHWDSWCNYVSLVAQTWGGTIDYYEVWNEPDLTSFFYGTVEQYRLLVCKSDSVLNLHDPSAQVILGGLAFPDYQHTSWFCEFLDETTHAAFDILGVHGYETQPNRALEKIHAVFDAESLPLKDIWVTETGYETEPYYTRWTREPRFAHPYSQADYVHRTMQMWRDDRVKAVLWYSAWDTDATSHFGLLDSAGVRKPAFHAFANWHPVDFSLRDTVSYDPQISDSYAGIYPVEICGPGAPPQHCSYAELDSVIISGHPYYVRKAFHGLNFDVDKDWLIRPGLKLKVEVDYADEQPNCVFRVAYDAVPQGTSVYDTTIFDWQSTGSLCPLDPDVLEEYAAPWLVNGSWTVAGPPTTTQGTGQIATARYRGLSPYFQGRMALDSDVEVLLDVGDTLKIAAVRCLWGPPPQLDLEDGPPFYVLGGGEIEIAWTACDAYDATELLSVDVALCVPDPAGPPVEHIVLQEESTGSRSFAFDPTDYVSEAEDGAYLTVTVTDLDGFATRAETGRFPIIAPSKAVFVNRSGETGADFSGYPYSSVGFDYDYDAQEERNLEDLMVTIHSGAQSSVLEGVDSLNENGVPRFSPVTDEAFSSSELPQLGLGGVSCADMENDGDLDLFCASGMSAAPRLYRNNGDGTFADVGDSLGITDLADCSWAGAWCDYDRDGWVDLFVARGGGELVPPESMMWQYARLLRNRLDPLLGNGTFEDVTAAAGISAGGLNAAASIAACWGDIDADGRADIYLAEYKEDAGGIRGKLFVQQSDGTFAEEAPARLPVGSLFCQAAAKFDDIDLDGDQDLVVGNRTFNTGAFVYWNDGSGYFSSSDPLTVPSVDGVSGMKVFDQDLDLRPDLLLTTRSASNTPRFFHNLLVGGELQLWDETAHVGLGSGNDAGGVTALDWNRDGDKDLYVGRPTSGDAFFYTTEESGTQAQDLGKHFVCVRLSSPQSVNNRAGIGAKVSIQVDDHWHHQWVDGGSGRGGQDDLAITFPVPASQGTYPVQVTWPNGWVQTYIAEVRSYDGQNPGGEDPEVIVDGTNPTVVNASVSASTSYDPNTRQFYWVFTWQTEYRSDWSLDKVSIGSCACHSAMEFTPSNSAQAVSRLSTGTYQHRLTATMACQAPCTIPYTVTSAHRTGLSSTSSQKTLKVTVCPQQ